LRRSDGGPACAARGTLSGRALQPRDVRPLLRWQRKGWRGAGGGGGVSGALWATASGIGFGLFQALNAKAVRDLGNAYVSTFLQLLIAAVVLVAASLATEDLGDLVHATVWGIVAFALAGMIHFFAGWTTLNLSQQRIGAARTSPLLSTTPAFGLAFGVAVVLALNLLSVPVVLVVAPLISGRHVEIVNARIWAGAGLVIAGSLLLIAET